MQKVPPGMKTISVRHFFGACKADAVSRSGDSILMVLCAMYPGDSLAGATMRVRRAVGYAFSAGRRTVSWPRHAHSPRSQLRSLAARALRARPAEFGTR